MPAASGRCVSLSTAEAEYVALSEAGRDVLWLHQLLAELGMLLANPTCLMEDNNSAIKWTEDSHAWGRSRHIDCSFHVRDLTAPLQIKNSPSTVNGTPFEEWCHYLNQTK